MAYMYDRDMVANIFIQMSDSCNKILKRFKRIKSHSDFLKDDKGLEKLDALCMQLIAVGESIKNLDKITHRTMLKKYPQFEWKKAMGMRDIISHHYFDLNSEIVFDVCKNEIPKLNKIVKTILGSIYSKSSKIKK